MIFVWISSQLTSREKVVDVGNISYFRVFQVEIHIPFSQIVKCGQRDVQQNPFKETLESVSVDWQLNKSQPGYVTHACSWHFRGNVGVSLFFSDSITYFLYWKFGQTRGPGVFDDFMDLL